MPVLNVRILVVSLVLLLALLILIFFNIWISIRKKYHGKRLFFYLASIFMGIFLACTLLDTTILGLSFAWYYKRIAVLGFFCSLFSFFLFLLQQRQRFGKIGSALYKTPDLSRVLYNLEDIVFIWDSRGNLCFTNQEEARALLIEDVAEHFLQASHLEYFWKEKNRHYVVESTPVFVNKKSKVGTLAVLHDVTAERLLMEEIKEKNQALEAVNQERKRYVVVAGEVESEKIALSIMEALKKDLIYKMETVITDMETLEAAAEENASIKAEMKEMERRLREIYQEIRKTIQTMHKGELSDD